MVVKELERGAFSETVGITNTSNLGEYLQKSCQGVIHLHTRDETRGFYGFSFTRKKISISELNAYIDSFYARERFTFNSSASATSKDETFASRWYYHLCGARANVLVASNKRREMWEIFATYEETKHQRKIRKALFYSSEEPHSKLLPAGKCQESADS